MTDQTSSAPDELRGPPLPDPVRAFFAAVAAEDPEAIAAAFVPAGVVHDDGEGLEVAGSAAIAGWAREHLLAASVRLEPEAADGDDGGWTVEVAVAGAFPGSPLRSTMRFALDGASIAELRTGTPR
jgi:hypothetical protein